MRLSLRSSAGRSAVSACGLALFAASHASAGTLQVTVLDAHTSAPISGAFVQVGPSPGIPFAANGGLTDPSGQITFDHASLVGPQSVTAAAVDHARASVIDAAVGAVTLSLRPSFAASLGLFDPAEISGTVSNIATQSNDGNLDIAIVLPALRLGDVLTQGSLAIEVPADTVNFPVVGEVVLPGNVVVPSQTELLFFTFAKPNYHFFLEDQATYDFVALAGRVPLDALQSVGPDILNLLSFREVGAERNVPVNGGGVLNINSDLNLTQNLTVSVTGAPNGSQLQVFSLADLPQGGESATVLFDAKSALADVQSSFVLAGRNPGGDLSDAASFVVGIYQDSSAAASYQAGRIDRTPITLPTSRPLDNFFELPSLAQADRTFSWTDVQAGGAPTPTWAKASFELGPADPNDGSIATEALWDVVAAASVLSFDLPLLPETAPGGLTDPAGTGAADALRWSHFIGDTPGGVTAALADLFDGLTTFSRRTEPVAPLPTSVESAVLQQVPGIDVLVASSPGRGPWQVRWAGSIGSRVGWELFDLAGRRVAHGQASTTGSNGQFLVESALGPGVYWCRVDDGQRSGVASLVVSR